jgi:predicted transcriptional regulator
MRAAIEGWNQSDVAYELGISPAAVSLRLSSLRRKGVKVPDITGWIADKDSAAVRLAKAYK